MPFVVHVEELAPEGRLGSLFRHGAASKAAFNSALVAGSGGSVFALAISIGSAGEGG